MELQYRKVDEWETCFDIQQAVNIPSVAYLGFSAETGELTDNFDIISIETKNLYTTNSNDNPAGKGSKVGSRKPSNNLNRGGTESEGGGWIWFLVKVLLFFGACGGGYVGYTMYRTQKRGSRFD